MDYVGGSWDEQYSLPTGAIPIGISENHDRAGTPRPQSTLFQRAYTCSWVPGGGGLPGKGVDRPSVSPRDCIFADIVMAMIVIITITNDGDLLIVLDTVCCTLQCHVGLRWRLCYALPVLASGRAGGMILST